MSRSKCSWVDDLIDLFIACDICLFLVTFAYFLVTFDYLLDGDILISINLVREPGVVVMHSGKRIGRFVQRRGFIKSERMTCFDETRRRDSGLTWAFVPSR